MIVAGKVKLMLPVPRLTPTRCVEVCKNRFYLPKRNAARWRSASYAFISRQRRPVPGTRYNANVVGATAQPRVTIAAARVGWENRKVAKEPQPALPSKYAHRCAPSPNERAAPTFASCTFAVFSQADNSNYFAVYARGSAMGTRFDKRRCGEN